MNFLRKIKRFSDKVLGEKSDELSWRFRHFFDEEWSNSYTSNDTFSHPHRELLIEKIVAFGHLENVLEIGCAGGANLFLLSKKLPHANYYGIDVSRKAIKEGLKFLKEKDSKNIFLQNLSAQQLKKIADKSMDVVFTDASIIYIGKNQIEKVFKDMYRIARKAIILCEQHTDGESFYDDKWVYNYKEILNKFAPEAKINFTKIPEDVWSGDWGKYGYIMEIKL